MYKKTALIIAFLMVGIGLSACSNTFHGAGQDIESAGEAIQDTFN